MEWVSGLYAAVAALAASRVVRRGGPGELVDLSIARGGEHHRHDRRRPHGLAARPPQPGAPGPQLRDAVDRADVRRLRRVQHEHPHAVRQLPVDDRAPRPHRRRVLGVHRAPGPELGAVERHRPRVDDEAHHRRGGGAGRRAADPGGAGVATAPRSWSFEQAAARGSLVDDPTGTFRVPRRSWQIDGEGRAAASPRAAAR